MRRRLFNIIAMISLLMFGLVVLFWVRSYSRVDYLSWDRGHRFSSLNSSNGLLRIGTIGWIADHELSADGWEGSFWPFPGPHHQYTFFIHSRLTRGFGVAKYGTGDASLYGDGLELVMPHWFLAAISSILPLIVLRRWIRNRNRNPFACITCGYDLRATPDRCPEYGTTTTLTGQRPDLSQPGASPQGTMRRSF